MPTETEVQGLIVEAVRMQAAAVCTRWLAGIENLAPTIEQATAALAGELLVPGLEIPEATVLRAELVTSLMALYNVGLAAMRESAARHFGEGLAPPTAPRPDDH